MPINYKICNLFEGILQKFFFLVLVMVTLSAEPEKQSLASTSNDIQHLVLEEAMNSNVPASLVLAVAKVESDFRTNALSPKGAMGVMQIMPATAVAKYGIKPEELWSARLNIQLGIDFLETLITRYNGRWDLALSHYNSGRIKKTDMQKLEPLPASQKYVSTVLSWQRRYESELRKKPFEGIAHKSSVIPLDFYVSHQPEQNLELQKGLSTALADQDIQILPGDLDDFNESLQFRLIEASKHLDDFAKSETNDKL